MGLAAPRRGCPRDVRADGPGGQPSRDPQPTPTPCPTTPPWGCAARRADPHARCILLPLETRPATLLTAVGAAGTWIPSPEYPAWDPLGWGLSGPPSSTFPAGPWGTYEGNWGAGLLPVSRASWKAQKTLPKGSYWAKEHPVYPSYLCRYLNPYLFYSSKPGELHPLEK